MRTASERLRQTRIAAGFSTAGGFATAFNFSATTYRAHESGSRNFKVRSAQAYAAALGLPSPAGWRWLMFGDESDRLLVNATETNAQSLTLKDDKLNYKAVWLSSGQMPCGLYARDFQDNVAHIPVFEISAYSWDGPSLFNGQPVDYFCFSSRKLQCLSNSSFSRLIGIVVCDDTMHPTLRKGDKILIDLGQRSALFHGIYLLTVDQALLIKTLTVNLATQQASIVSDNSLYQPFDHSQLEASEIIGRVIWLSRRL